MLVFGDSIGVRAQMGLGIPLDNAMARVGAAPDEVAGKISNYQGDLSGQEVVLSTGVSNDPSKIEEVREQLALLKQRGAKNILLLGVSSQNANYNGCNETLQGMATECGATFVPIPDTSSDPMNVHPPVGALHRAIITAQADGVHDLVYRFGGDGQPKPQINDGVYHFADNSPQSRETNLPAPALEPAPARGGYLAKEELAPMSRAQVGEIQELLKEVNIETGSNRYNIGTFGVHKDGVDKTLGDFTSHSIQDYERNHHLGNASASELIADLKKTVQLHSEPAELPTSATTAFSADRSAAKRKF